VDTLVLDFSHVSNIKPIEIYAFLAEMAAVPRSRNVSLSIEGLHFTGQYFQDFFRIVAEEFLVSPVEAWFLHGVIRVIITGLPNRCFADIVFLSAYVIIIINSGFGGRN
jgi:hypothetical protein